MLREAGLGMLEAPEFLAGLEDTPQMSDPREAAIAAQLGALGDYHQWFTAKEIAALPRVLTEGENVRALTSGSHKGNTWLVVVTDQRLLLLDKGLVYGLKQVDFSLHQISGVSHGTGLLFGELQISTSAGTAVIGNIPKAEAAKVAGVLSDLVRNSHERSAPARLAAATDVASQLERLAALMDRGLLTKEEFMVQKTRLLS